MFNTSTRMLLTSMTLLLGCGGRVEEDGYNADFGDGVGGRNNLASYGGAEAATREPAVGGTMMQMTHMGGSPMITPIPAGGVSANSTYIPVTGGSVATTGVAAPCTTATDFIALALSSVEGSWVGGNPFLEGDNPCGVQGAVYAYSDRGLDGIGGSLDDSLDSPAHDASSSDVNQRFSPCTRGKCCISGTTHHWPKNSAGALDYTADVWGAGIGLALSDYQAAGADKLRYQGPAHGFVVSLSGTLMGQVVRIAYPQVSNGADAPFREYTKLGTFAVPFNSVTCPTWSSSCLLADYGATDLQIQIVGGDVAGDYQVCIDSITPML